MEILLRNQFTCDESNSQPFEWLSDAKSVLFDQIDDVDTRSLFQDVI